MEIKIKNLKEKVNLINSIDLSINDKLTYVVKKLQNKIKQSLKEPSDKFNELLEDIKVDLCDKDDKGLILSDDKGNLSFKNVDNLKLLNTKIKELNTNYDETEVNIEPHLILDLPRLQDLDLFLVDELTGLLF